MLLDISERVHFARSRFGQYEVIDFVAILLGYAVSSERTLEAFYELLLPFANAFMAIFDRDRLPHRSTLYRFLAALNQTTVESLRASFLKDLLARLLEKDEKPGGLWDRQGNYWLVFDVDGTRQAARVSRLALYTRSPTCTPPIGRGLRPWLYRTQAWGDCSDSDHSTPGSYTPMGWHILRDIWGR